MNKKILITGAAGFIGSNLLKYFLKHYKACYYIIIRKTSDLWRINDIKSEVNIIELDLTDEKKLNKKIKKINPEIIFHLSAFGGFPAIQNDINKIIKNNILGTLNLLNCAAGLKSLSGFIHTGSSSEYGIKKSAMKENDLLTPVSYYGCAKACLTLLSQVFSHQSKLPVINLRLFSPYGYYDSYERLISYVIISLLKNNDIIINHPDSVRDYIFIDDVISAYLKALDIKNKHGQVYNIGSGKEMKISKVVNLIRKHIASESKIILKKGNPPENESLKWQASVTKAGRDMNWKPQTNIEDGIIKTINWYRNNIHLYS